MKIAITGAEGFLGWHIRCALKAQNEHRVVAIGRELTSPDLVDASLRTVDVVLHCAGVNRAEGNELREGNLALAVALTQSLERVDSRPIIVYANSIHCGNGSAFGDGKLAAASHLMDWSTREATSFVDVVLPNLFGEHGRPNYNSFVATFCSEIAAGRTPVVTENREVPLLHVQRAVEEMLALGHQEASGQVRPLGNPTLVSAIQSKLAGFRDLYASGQIPDVRNLFDLDLFNTYRSYCSPDLFPIMSTKHSDERGDLFEALRAHGGQSQVFCSTTRPGFTRGEHFHLRKVERFLVIRGQAEIALRRLFSKDVVQFDVSGDRPAIIDMPTMWAHNITNTGDDELVTLFWTHELLNPDHTDTFPERVRLNEVTE